MWILQDINRKNRKKFLKIMVILLIIIWGSYWWYHYYNVQKIKKIDYKTVKVEAMDIFSTFSSDWKVYYKEQYDINFPISWTLSNIYKKEGEEVKIGEIIAKLDDKILQINLDKAKIALETAESNLNAKLSTKWQISDLNISEEQLKSNEVLLQNSIKQWEIDIKNASKNLDSILVNLNNTRNSINKDIENTNKTIETRKKDIENTKDTLKTIQDTENLNIKNAKEKAISEINLSLSLIDKSLRDIDIIIWVSPKNEHLNDAFEMYLWAKNLTYKNITEESYRKISDTFEIFKTNYLWNIDIVDENLNTIILIYNDTILTLNQTKEMLKNSISANNFPQNSIDSMISNMDNNINSLSLQNQKFVIAKQNISSSELSLETKVLNAENNIKSANLQLEQANINLEKIKSQSKITIEDLQKKYELARINLESAKIKSQNNIESSNSQINISKANLNYKKAPFDNRELEPFYVSVKNAKKWLEEAQRKLDDTTIKSPINWKIGKLTTTKIGTNITSNPTAPFVTIINKNSLYIEAKIEEWDIDKIKLWQETNITFNSVENVKLKWKVEYISDKAETDINNIVTYKIEIILETKDDRVKEWFTTQIYFILEKSQNALVLPTETVKQENDNFFVTLKNWEKRKIKTWINDWDYIEIKDWLKKDDEVIY